MQIFRKTLPLLVSLLLTAGMVAASELLQNREIIFPEITAVAIGALAAPKQSWNASKLRILLTITAAAVIGVGLVFLPLPLVIKLPLAMTAAVVCVTVSQTEFLPATSACVLPVLLGTRSPVYIGSVVVMTSLILLTQWILERCGMRGKDPFMPIKPDRPLLGLRLKQIIAAGILCILPAVTGEIFFIAPPLIVAFFELSKPGSRLLERVPQVISLILTAAVSGVISRFVLTEKLGLPLAAAAVCACAVILLLVCKMQLYFPPCGAIATLPFIIPESALLKFPFEIAAGTLLFIGVAFVLSRKSDMITSIKSLI